MNSTTDDERSIPWGYHLMFGVMVLLIAALFIGLILVIHFLARWLL